MTDYIRRDTLIEDIGEAVKHRGMGEIIGQTLRRYILRQAAADVAEVVRCKNCKWFADNNGGEWYGCKMFHVVRITPEDAPKPDDFCSYGERRKGGNDNVSD